MYKLIVTKYHRPYMEYNGKNSVFSRFKESITTCIPVNVTRHKTRIIYVFTGGKFTERYILPITAEIMRITEGKCNG